MINPIMETALKEHYEARDAAIEHLVSLYKDDFDIESDVVLNSVLRRFGLDHDGFPSEKHYILKEALQRI